MKNKKVLGNLILFGTALVWGFAFVFQRTGMDDIGPFAFNAWRMIITTIVLIPVVMVSDALKRSKGTNPEKTLNTEELKEYKLNGIKGGCLAGIFVAVGSCFQQWGLVTVSAGKSGFITALYILLVPVVNLVVFRHKASKLQWIGVVIGTMGLFLLCFKSGEGFISLGFGDILLMLCALSYSFQILFIDQYAYRCDPIRLAVWQSFSAFVISFVITICFEGFSLEAAKAAMVPILYCGLVSGGVGYTGQTIGQSLSDPVPATLIMSLESVFSVLAGWLVLREVLSAREFIGCIVMFTAIVIAQLPEKQTS